jgi:hypothetical protein
MQERPIPDFAALHPGYALFAVIAGLDPAIHEAQPRKRRIEHLHDTSSWMQKEVGYIRLPLV